MKKLLLTLGMTLGMLVSTFAAYIANAPTHLVQPDGDEIDVFTTGDEYYHWLHDANNYTIVKDPESGFFVYATKGKNGYLLPTAYIVGETDPASAGLTPGINLEGEVRKEKIQSSPLWVNTAPNAKSRRSSALKITSSFMNQLVVFISFSDSPTYVRDLSYFDNNFNATGAKSVKDFFDEASGGFIDINTTFYPDQAGSSTILSYQDTHPRGYYENGGSMGYTNGTERTEREHGLLKRAIESIQSQVPATLDIDADNDNYVDNVVFIIQGSHDGWSNLLWPHRWSLYSDLVEINGLRVYDYNLVLELSGSEVGVLSHELFHSFGAPDLYRYSDNTITPVGGWDLMASQPWSTPIHMNTYYKRKFAEWGPEIPEITEAGTYTLEAISSNPFSSYKIAIPNAPNQFLLLEYRRRDGLYENALPGEGLVIFRINESLNGNAGGPDDEIYVFRPGGELLVNGQLSQAGFSSTNNRTAFNDYTDPYLFTTEDALGGFGVNGISNVTALGSNTISFDFTPPAEENGDISGPNCLIPNTSVIYELSPSHRVNLTGVSWWYNGASYGIQPNASEPWKATITTGPWFSAGQLCAGVNYNGAPWYATYCKEISVCGAAKHNSNTVTTTDDVHISPNPTTDVVTIEGVNNFTRVVVSDISGAEQSVSYETGSNYIQLQVSHLTKGTYLVSLTGDAGASTFKFIKQ